MTLLRRAGDILIGILRELSDQTAYERHLKAHGVPKSGEEWRRFSERRFQERFTRPKCC